MPPGTAGEVFYLLSQQSLPIGAKDRRCPLLTSCESDEAGVFAYATTQTTELIGEHPPVFVPIQPRPGYREFANSFTEETFVLPGVLSSVAMSEVGGWEGTLNASELKAIVSAVPRALAFGSGIDRKGVRGGIVRLGPVYASVMDAKFGVVLTEPGYSRRNRGYQTIIPIIDDGEPLDDHEVSVERPSWLQAIYPGAASALFAVRDVLSVYPEYFEPGVIRWIATTELEAIEGALRRLLGC